jgi:hypothetical protein
MNISDDVGLENVRNDDPTPYMCSSSLLAVVGETKKNE